MSDLTLKLWVECQLLLEDAKARLREFERGQGMVEYSLILALVAVAAMTLLYSIGTNVATHLTNVRDCLQTPATC